MLLAAKASNEQLFNNIFSILKGWQGIEGDMKPWNAKRRIMEVEENPKSGHFKMGRVKRHVTPRNSKRRTMEKIQEAEEDTESVLFEMGEQQNTSRRFLRRRQEIEGNTESVHFEMGEQQNTGRGFLGRRQAVEDKVPKRTCGFLPGILWFCVVNLL